MTERLNRRRAAANAGAEGMQQTEAWLREVLDPGLLELVKMRASQINGCAFCIHMHAEEAGALGEEPRRLLLLAAWRESALFTERERAALRWTESLTDISRTGAPDADYEAVRSHFREEEVAALSIAIGMINAWNRLAVGFRWAHPADRAGEGA